MLPSIDSKSLSTQVTCYDSSFCRSQVRMMLPVRRCARVRGLAAWMVLLLSLAQHSRAANATQKESGPATQTATTQTAAINETGFGSTLTLTLPPAPTFPKKMHSTSGCSRLPTAALQSCPESYIACGETVGPAAGCPAVTGRLLCCWVGPDWGPRSGTGVICVQDEHCLSRFCNATGKCAVKLAHGSVCYKQSHCEDERCGYYGMLVARNGLAKFVVKDRTRRRCCKPRSSLRSSTTTYCRLLEGGATCHAGAECNSNACQDGVCTAKPKLSTGASCLASSHCESSACGGLSTSFACCATGKSFVGPLNTRYCSHLPADTRCRFHQQCTSGVCSAGVCRARLDGGAACSSDNDCASATCGHYDKMDLERTTRTHMYFLLTSIFIHDPKHCCLAGRGLSKHMAPSHAFKH